MSYRSINSRLDEIERLAQRKRLVLFSPAIAYPEYTNDPIGFIRNVLHETPTPQQAGVLEALLTHRRVMVSSGHSTGKSKLGCWLVLWWHYCHEGPCLTTAPTDRQVRDILWKEVRVTATKAGLPDRWVGPKIPRLEHSPENFAHGFTARDATRFHGQHSKHGVFVVFDEAEGIGPGFWTSLKSMLDDESYFIGFYNPTENGSACHQAEQEADLHGTFKRLTLSCLDHPNVTCDPDDPLPVPGAITRKQLRAMLVEDSQILSAEEEKQATDIFLDGVWYRPGPIAEARCLGRRPQESTQGLWGETLWRRVLDTRHEIVPAWPVQIGCDVARYGDDQTAIFIRHGLAIVHVETHLHRNTSEVAGRLRELAHMSSNPFNDERKIPTLIDDTGGWGGGVIDQAQGYRFIGVNNTKRARDENRFRNCRTELWFAGRQPALELSPTGKGCCLDLTRVHPSHLHRLKNELMCAKYRILPVDNRIMVTPKEDMKVMLGRSPDLADGYNLSIYPVK